TLNSFRINPIYVWTGNPPVCASQSASATARSLMIVEDAASAKRRRDFLLVSHGRVEIGFGPMLLLHGTNKSMKALETAKLVRVAEFGCLQRRLENCERFLVSL